MRSVGVDPLLRIFLLLISFLILYLRGNHVCFQRFNYISES